MIANSCCAAPHGSTQASRVVSPVSWPEGKRFAFSVFDDTDSSNLENVPGVYSFLQDCGMRTTKSCWVVDGDPRKGDHSGATCENPDYLRWLLGLQSQGFEIGWHNATWHGLPRQEVLAALDRFTTLFQHDPKTAANHSYDEGIYWGDARLTGIHTFFYNLATAWRNHRAYRGHVEGDDFFWGDICQARIQYYRNFVFRDVNTLKACPFMPYHDPQRPYVKYWYASSAGKDVRMFNRCLSEFHQDRLEEEGGACIIYTHFASGFQQNESLEPDFVRLVKRLSRKNGWFVPVGILLDHLLRLRGHKEISDAERRRIERKWLLEKLFTRTT